MGELGLSLRYPPSDVSLFHTPLFTRSLYSQAKKMNTPPFAVVTIIHAIPSSLSLLSYVRYLENDDGFLVCDCCLASQIIARVLLEKTKGETEMAVIEKETTKTTEHLYLELEIGLREPDGVRCYLCFEDAHISRMLMETMTRHKGVWIVRHPGNKGRKVDLNETFYGLTNFGVWSAALVEWCKYLRTALRDDVGRSMGGTPTFMNLKKREECVRQTLEYADMQGTLDVFLLQTNVDAYIRYIIP